MKLGKTAGERTTWSWWTRLPLTCLLLGLLTAAGAAAGSALWLPLRAGDGWSTHAQATRPRDAARAEGEGSVLVDKWSRPGAVFYEVWAAPVAPDGMSTGSPTDARTPEALLASWPAWGESAKLPWARGAAAWPANGAIDTRFIEARGWPFPMAWCEYTVDWGSRAGAIAHASGAWVRQGPPELKGSSRAIKFDRAIPHRLIPAGIGANMLILGAAWFALLRPIHELRRVKWKRRGLCARCGHEVSPDGRCTQCRWTNTPPGADRLAA